MSERRHGSGPLTEKHIPELIRQIKFADDEIKTLTADLAKERERANLAAQQLVDIAKENQDLRADLAECRAAKDYWQRTCELRATEALRAERELTECRAELNAQDGLAQDAVGEEARLRKAAEARAERLQQAASSLAEFMSDEAMYPPHYSDKLRSYVQFIHDALAETAQKTSESMGNTWCACCKMKVTVEETHHEPKIHGRPQSKTMGLGPFCSRCWPYFVSSSFSEDVSGCKHDGRPRERSTEGASTSLHDSLTNAARGRDPSGVSGDEDGLQHDGCPHDCPACTKIVESIFTAPSQAGEGEKRGIPRTDDDSERRGNVHIPAQASEDDAERAAREWIDDSASVAASLFENGPPTKDQVTATLSALRRQERLDVARHVPTLNDLDGLCEQARADERSKVPCPHPLEKIDADYICTRCGIEQPALRERDAQAREAGRVEGWNDAVEACAKLVDGWHEDAREMCPSTWPELPNVLHEVRDEIRALKRPDRAKGGGKS